MSGGRGSPSLPVGFDRAEILIHFDIEQGIAQPTPNAALIAPMSASSVNGLNRHSTAPCSIR